ncbi:aconitase subunit 1 [Aestuariivirga litoralis]|uniref:Aconitase subunit 1 n=1 Tax=Aestuariivirga litoralis TaxID=2650924 RepID=A0A2W2AJF1_9HYPH|nr:aconitase X catalytic domain-containing protein [Aestuariivirga litoralis]PZF75575.1 aconitase subunit 1 [Aestuariivirga litoralis]
MSVELPESVRAQLAGEHGPAMQLAARLVVKAADIMKAERLIPITFAHLDACFYTGQAHVDFVRFLTENGAALAVETWTNNGVVSLADASLRPREEDPEMVEGAAELMHLYETLGTRPTWTCAPYQLPGGPKFGDHIAVGESNAVSYYNSVVGARTNKYGDYLDVACALTGLAPDAGLHRDEGRRAELHIDAAGLPEAWRREDIFAHLIGHHAGRIAGRRVPVISGLAGDAPKHALKAISSAAASSGGVELWHGTGVTPEAPELGAVFGSGETHVVTREDLARAHHELSTARDGPLDAVALGTPHFGLGEFEALVALFDGRKVKAGLPMLVSTSRGVRAMAQAKGWIAALEACGVEVPVDVCTYHSPRVRGLRGRVMTNAAKWAYYAPGMLGVEVAFGSLKECVESAIRGAVWRDPHLWTNA